MQLEYCYSQKLIFGDTIDARSRIYANEETVNKAFREFKKNSLDVIHIGNWVYSWKDFYNKQIVEIVHYVKGEWNNKDIVEMPIAKAKKHALTLVQKELDANGEEWESMVQW